MRVALQQTSSFVCFVGEGDQSRFWLGGRFADFPDLSNTRGITILLRRTRRQFGHAFRCLVSSPRCCLWNESNCLRPAPQ